MLVPEFHIPQRKNARADGLLHALRHLHQFLPLHVRPRDVRCLRPVAAKHDRHAALRVAARGIVVAADLLAGRDVERVVTKGVGSAVDCLLKSVPRRCKHAQGVRKL